MAIREDVVASATQFLQDPSVATSSIENRVAFLRTKNLTQDEIDTALARAGDGQPTAPPAPTRVPHSQQQQLYQQPYSPQYTAWQPPPPTPKRDWRDWFIMATVVGGVSYGAFTLAKRYVYPLIAPPTPEKLEQDKKSIEEQFDKAFGLVEQLAKDTEALKEAEQQRTEKLDKALSELEMVMRDLRSANSRRETETQRIKDDVQTLKDSIPKAMETQKEATDSRLKEVNSELTSLKTLITQRMNAVSVAANATGLRNNGSTAPASSGLGRAATSGNDNENAGNDATNNNEASKPTTATPSFSRASPFSGKPAGKASIPAWQMAMANSDNKESNTSSSAGANGVGAEGSSQPESASS
ncbi:Peroxisomal membrane protein PER10 [Colletotrichum sidae]|uniref:Peroxisomal membrane protein PEX14 n=1 Tax=Colletotrichum sidae TaxID=1347389 RepID=A0A4V3I138_9PEZI|nr:Peroxisomal membrane protein PER10 [Colletotrichum sidae]